MIIITGQSVRAEPDAPATETLPWMFAASIVWWILIELRHRQIVDALADVVTNVGKEIGFKPVAK